MIIIIINKKILTLIIIAILLTTIIYAFVPKKEKEYNGVLVNNKLYKGEYYGNIY